MKLAILIAVNVVVLVAVLVLYAAFERVERVTVPLHVNLDESKYRTLAVDTVREGVKTIYYMKRSGK